MARPSTSCSTPWASASRMNVGQILETHLGWAASGARLPGHHPRVRRRDRGRSLRSHRRGQCATVDKRISRNQGRPRRPKSCSPTCPPAGKIQLYDGRTGEPVRPENHRRLHVHHQAAPPRRRQDPRPCHRPLLPHHPATPRWQSPHRRPTLRRDGGLGARSLRRRVHPSRISSPSSPTTSKAVPRSTSPWSRAPTPSKPACPSRFDVLCNEIKGLGPEHHASRRAELEGSGSFL